MKFHVAQEGVTISVKHGNDGGVEVLANGEVLLWINETGTITLCANRGLAQLGFQLDNECVGVEN